MVGDVEMWWAHSEEKKKHMSDKMFSCIEINPRKAPEDDLLK